MNVYTKLMACLLYVKSWSWIKAYDTQKDGRQATENLREHYEGAGEGNKHVAWATENMDNYHFTSKNTYSFEKFSTILQHVFTI